MSKQINIGLFGFGVVGQGLYDIISQKDLNINIQKIAIKDAGKERSLPKELFTTEASEILNDERINTIVELINDADAAFTIVSTALKNGKNVVSANKKMIAEHLDELIELQKKHNVSFLYEGAVCGSIPIIRNLEEYYDNEFLHSVSGIFNGSSNYILSKVFGKGQSYSSALSEAQDLGFAETDPTLDVGGFDPKYKLSIVTTHAYGTVVKPENILNIGIQNLSQADISFAKENGAKIKLIPTVRNAGGSTIALYVLPKLVDESNFLYNVENEYNAVNVQAAFADQQFFYGKGAGGHPTGSAVLSDITALRYGYQYEYKKHFSGKNPVQDNAETIRVYFRTNNPALATRLGLANSGEKAVIGNVSIGKLLEYADELRSDGNFIIELPGNKEYVLNRSFEEAEAIL